MNKTIAQEVEKAIALVAKKYNVTITADTLNITQKVSLPIRQAVVKQIPIKTTPIKQAKTDKKGIITRYVVLKHVKKIANKETFLRLCKEYGIKPNEYGMGIYTESCHWHLVGINDRATKNPLVFSDGKNFIGLSKSNAMLLKS